VAFDEVVYAKWLIARDGLRPEWIRTKVAESPWWLEACSGSRPEEEWTALKASETQMS
jgi:hypothetical protein